MWSLGCVFAELLLRGPIFPAQPQRPEHEEREQLAQIFRIMGTPIDPDTDPQAAAAAFAAAGLEAEAESVAAAAAAAAAAATSSAASAAAASSSTLPTPVHPQPLPCNLPVWPGCSSLPGHADFEARKPQPWASVFPPGWVSAGALDLLSQLLVFDPLRRLTAEQALRHPYFSAEPLPTPPERLPLPAAALAAAARR
jgi:serine/threonine protein kinase